MLIFTPVMRNVLLLICVLLVSVNAQFGTNKLQYKKNYWQTIKTSHFDIYYSENSRKIATFAADYIETVLDSITNNLHYNIKKRIPVIIYKSQSDFEQTNVITDEIGEGTGGFTEIFKSRIVVPFDGSWPDFKHVVHHELTHAVMFDLIFENVFNAFRYRASFQMPLWVAEGLAEYESARWNLESDMFLMDAVISGYIAEPEQEFGTMYLAYKAGMAFYNFMVVQYGEDCVGDFIKYMNLFKNVDKAFKNATHTTLKRAGEYFLLFLKKKYWPELGRRDNASEIARRLTLHRTMGYFTVQPDEDPLANLNIQPSVSPDGKTIAYFSDRDDFIGIYLIDARTGKPLSRIAESGTSDKFESFHSYKSGIAWSHDSKRILFVARSQGKDVIRIMDVNKKKVILTLPFSMDRIEYPDWSPSEDMVVMSGLVKGQSDIYIFEIKKGELRKITSDENYDTYPRFSPDGSKIVFESEFGGKKQFGCNGFDLFMINTDGSQVKRLTESPFDDRMAAFANDNKNLFFVSNRSGLSNVYVMALDSLVPHPVTNVFAGCFNPTVPENDSFMVFSVFENGGWDVFRIDSPLKRAMGNALPLTDYARSLTDSSFVFWRKTSMPPIPNDTAGLDSALKAKRMKRDSLKAISEREIPAMDSAQFDTTKKALAKTDSTEPDSIDYEEPLPERTPFSPMGTADVFGPDPYSVTKKHREPRPLVDTSAFIHDTTEFKNPNGSYKETPYSPKFTFDAISAMVGGVASPNAFAVGGQAEFALSDILGNHQIFVAANLYGNTMQNPLDELSGYLAYYYLPYRTDLGASMYRYVNAFGTEDSAQLHYDLFLDAIYNANVQVIYPFSRFLRVEGNAGISVITRNIEHYSRPVNTDGYTRINREKDKSLTNYELGAATVFDNTLWGNVGPVNGLRMRLSGLVVPPGSGSNYSYGVAMVDGRKYFHYLKKYVLALRFSGGKSIALEDGANPKLFYLGGVPDNISYLFMPYYLDNSIATNYFSSIVMPLRGYSIGAANPKGNTQFVLSNMEFRFPFITNLSIYFPLPISINYIMGAVFWDIGAAWDNPDTFKGARSSSDLFFTYDDIKSGIGFGLRMNLFGGIVIKWDRALRLGVDHVREDYFSLGAEF